MRQLLGKFPGKTLHRVGIAIGSFWLTGLAIDLFLLAPEKKINPEIKEEVNSLYKN